MTQELLWSTRLRRSKDIAEYRNELHEKNHVIIREYALDNEPTLLQRYMQENNIF